MRKSIIFTVTMLLASLSVSAFASTPAPQGSEPELQLAEKAVQSKKLDDAILHYEYALKDAAWAQGHAEEWKANLDKLMNIVVHEKHNPSLALELMSEFSLAKSIPGSMASEVANWKKELRALRNHKEVGESAYSGFTFKHT